MGIPCGGARGHGSHSGLGRGHSHVTMALRVGRDCGHVTMARSTGWGCGHVTMALCLSPASHLPIVRRGCSSHSRAGRQGRLSI